MTTIAYDIWRTVWDSDDWTEEVVDYGSTRVATFISDDRMITIQTGREGRVNHAWRKYADGPDIDWIGPATPNKAGIVVAWLTRPWPKHNAEGSANERLV